MKDRETITILAGRADEARKRMKKFVKKARRYNVPFTASFGPEYTEERERVRPDGRKVKYLVSLVDVTIEGEKPTVGDYEFQASIELTPAGNYVDMAPGVELDPKYRHVNDHCEHCKAQRRRKHVFVVRDRSSGQFVQVGRTCLRDFLGTDDPSWVLQSFKFWRAVRGGDDDGLGGLGSVSWWESLDTLLAHTNACIRIWGWTSKGQARFNEDLCPTVNRVWSLYSSSEADKKEAARIREEIKDSDYELAERVIKWVRCSTDDTDYMHNLRVAFYDDMLWDERRVGLAISAVAAWHKAEERELKLAREREQAAQSTHIGAQGERLRGIKARLESRRGMGDNGYGWTELLKFRTEDGNVLTWFTGAAGNVDIGEDVVLDGTVKAHKEYQGARETQLTRVKMELAA